MLLLPPLLLLAACSPPPYTPADTAGSTEPSVTVTWPLPERDVVGCTVVTVDVQNLKLTDFTTPGLEDVPGQGHYHVTTPAGYTAVWTPYALIAFPDIADTLANLNVQLVNNLHELLLDGNGDPYEYNVPVHYLPGECVEFGATPTDSDYDTNMDSMGGA